MENNVTNVTNATDDEGNYWSLPPSYHVLFKTLYILTIFLSIVGNVLEVVVLVVSKRLSFDVRCSLVNLAVADIMMAIFCIPFTCSQYVSGEWFYSIQLCGFVLFIEEMIVMVSVFTLTAIGINRYLAILHPFKFPWMKSNNAIFCEVAIIWASSISASAVIPFHITINSGDDQYKWCSNEWPTRSMEIAYAVNQFLVTYAIPLIILVFTYSCIAWKLLTHTFPGNGNAKKAVRHHQKTIRAVKMLSLIVILFALCWAPLRIFILISWVNQDILYGMDHLTNKILYVTIHWLAMSNSFVNPIIYSFGNNDFCKDLRYIFNKLIGRKVNDLESDYKHSNESGSTSITKTVS